MWPTLRALTAKLRKNKPLRRRPAFCRPALELLEDRLAPATLVVNSLGDTVSGVTPTLDLREAILLVNSGGTATDAAGNSLSAAKGSQISGAFGVNDTIQFDLGPGSQTITLNGELEVTQSVAIDGPGPNLLAVSGNYANTVFVINTAAVTASASLSGLTIEDGSGVVAGGIYNASNDALSVSNCTLADNTGSGGGGAIYSSAGTVTVSNSILTGNSSSGGSGGVSNSGTLTLSNCVLSDNSAAEFGGGIYNAGTLTVSNSFLSENGAYGQGIAGGGVFNIGNAQVLLSNTTLYGNYAQNGDGGGIENFGALTVSDSTLSDNTAVNGSGGGIENGDGTLTVSASTLSGNVAGGQYGSGGGIYVQAPGGTVTVTDSTLSGNSAGDQGGGLFDNSTVTVALNGSIVAGDSAANGGLDAYGDISGFYNMVGNGDGLSGHNRIENGSDGNLVGLTASQVGLAPLGSYDGPIQTIALLPGSLAIDAGNPSDTSPDQRGVPVQNGVRDIGAFESHGFSIFVSSGDNQQAPAGTAFASPLTVLVTANDPAEPVVGGQVNFTAPATAAGANLSSTTASINSDGQASVTATANDTLGGFTVSAATAGATGGPAVFDLTNAITEASLQQALSPTTPVTVQTNASTDADEVITAVNQLPSYSTAVTVTLNLAAGTSSGDLNPSPPSGVTLVINGQGGTTTIVGQSPALTVSSGTVVVTGMTLTTATDAPTILVTGGSLQLRNDDVESSTGSAQAAISVTGGGVDLGTATSPGGNVLNINGTGTWFQNTTSNPIPDVGDTFEINGTAQSVVTWTGADNNGEWDDGGNWSTGSVPGPNDVTVITQSGITVTLGDGSGQPIAGLQSNANVVLANGSLTISGPSTISGNLQVSGGTLAEASSLMVGFFNWTGGAIAGAGDLTVTGSATLQQADPLAATPPIFNNTGLYLENGTLTLAGTTNWISSVVSSYSTVATLNNTGTLYLQGNNFFGSAFVTPGLAVFRNYGDLEQQDAGTTLLGGQVTNDGTVDVQQGQLEMGYATGSSASTTSTGSYYGAAGTTLYFVGNQVVQGTITADIVAFAVSPGLNGFTEGYFNGGGTVVVQGGYTAATATNVYSGNAVFQGTVDNVGATLDVLGGSADFTGAPAAAFTLTALTVNGTLLSNDAYTVTGTLSVGGGVFDDSAASTTASLDWTGGGIEGSGNLTVAGPATIQSASGNGLLLENGTLTLAGSTAWVNTVVVAYYGVEAIVNDGTVSFQGDSLYAFESVVATFTNDGVIQQDVAGSSTLIQANFTNDGSVTVEQGVLEMGYASGTPVTTTSTGTFYGAPGTTLEFGGSQTFAPTSSISADQFVVEPGTHLVFQIAGNTPGAGFDQITVGSSATLAGSLGVVMLNGFTPYPGETFAILNNQGITSGTFSGLPEGGTIAAGGDQYQITYVGGDGNDVVLTAIVVAPTVSVTDSGGTYNGSAFAATGTAVGADGTTPVAGTFSYTYYAGSTASGTGSSAAPVNAGTYTVVASFTSTEAGYADGVSAATFTIDPAILTVTARSATKVYGRANPTFTDTITGFVDHQTASVVSGSASLTTSATASTGVGSYAINTAQGSLSAANYTFAFVGSTLTVTPATLHVTAKNAVQVYGAATPTFAAAFSGFVNGDTAGVLNGSASLTTSATRSSGVGTYTIVAAVGTLSAANYVFTFANGTLTVTPAVLTVAAADASMVYGASVPTLTDTIAGFVNNDPSSVVSGSATLATSAMNASDVGKYAITVGLGSLSAANYTFKLVNGTLAVTPATLTVTANDASRVYGDANPTFTDTISGFVNGDPSSVVTGNASLKSTATKSSGVGAYTITAAQGSLSATDYTFAFVAGTLTVTPALLTVTANNASAIYGEALPSFTDTFTGFVNGDKAANAVSGSASLTTSATQSSGVGTYPIVAAEGTLSAANYVFTFANGTLTVTPAVLTVTATDTSMVYGAPVPILTDTIAGFVNGDPSSVVSGSAALATSATSSSDVGNYSITVGLGSLSAANYTFKLVNGTLAVTPATLTVTANDASRVYGEANPTFTDTITGFVNGDPSSVVTGNASLKTMATKSSGVGAYAITAAQGSLSATDYTFAFVAGTLTITPATLTVTAKDASKVYGAALPSFTDTITGFVNGDNAASAVTGSASLSTSATASSNVGVYPITAAQGSLNAANYIFVFQAGTLTVTPAVVTVTANSFSKVQGTANPTFTDTITGFVNGDTASVLSGIASLTTTATASSPVGTYTITAALGSLSAANYTFVFVNGKLKVTAS